MDADQNTLLLQALTEMRPTIEARCSGGEEFVVLDEMHTDNARSVQIRMKCSDALDFIDAQLNASKLEIEGVQE